MIGYCQQCGMMVEILDIQTERLSNLSYVHTGKCSCGEKIIRRIKDGDLIFIRPGHHIPAEVYAGPRTPARITRIKAGQKIIRQGKVEKTTPPDGGIKTLGEVKKEVRKNVKTEKSAR